MAWQEITTGGWTTDSGVRDEDVEIRLYRYYTGSEPTALTGVTILGPDSGGGLIEETGRAGADVTEKIFPGRRTISVRDEDRELLDVLAANPGGHIRVEVWSCTPSGGTLALEWRGAVFDPAAAPPYGESVTTYTLTALDGLARLDRVPYLAYNAGRAIMVPPSSQETLIELLFRLLAHTGDPKDPLDVEAAMSLRHAGADASGEATRQVQHAAQSWSEEAHLLALENQLDEWDPDDQGDPVTTVGEVLRHVCTVYGLQVWQEAGVWRVFERGARRDTFNYSSQQFKTSAVDGRAIGGSESAGASATFSPLVTGTWFQAKRGDEPRFTPPRVIEAQTTPIQRGIYNEDFTSFDNNGTAVDDFHGWAASNSVQVYSTGGGAIIGSVAGASGNYEGSLIQTPPIVVRAQDRVRFRGRVTCRYANTPATGANWQVGKITLTEEDGTAHYYNYQSGAWQSGSVFVNVRLADDQDQDISIDHLLAEAPAAGRITLEASKASRLSYSNPTVGTDRNTYFLWTFDVERTAATDSVGTFYRQATLTGTSAVGSTEPEALILRTTQGDLGADVQATEAGLVRYLHATGPTWTDADSDWTRSKGPTISNKALGETIIDYAGRQYGGIVQGFLLDFGPDAISGAGPAMSDTIRHEPDPVGGSTYHCTPYHIRRNRYTGHGHIEMWDIRVGGSFLGQGFPLPPGDPPDFPPNNPDWLGSPASGIYRPGGLGLSRVRRSPVQGFAPRPVRRASTLPGALASKVAYDDIFLTQRGEDDEDGRALYVRRRWTGEWIGHRDNLSTTGKVLQRLDGTTAWIHSAWTTGAPTVADCYYQHVFAPYRSRVAAIQYTDSNNQHYYEEFAAGSALVVPERGFVHSKVKLVTTDNLYVYINASHPASGSAAMTTKGEMEAITIVPETDLAGTPASNYFDASKGGSNFSFAIRVIFEEHYASEP